MVISRSLPSFVERLKAGLRLQENILFAIHPGGPKIIEQVKAALNLTEEQVKHSRAVLQNCGNMSSATLPHIWESLARDPEVKPGTQIVSLAYGPGLTACGAIFEKVR